MPRAQPAYRSDRRARRPPRSIIYSPGHGLDQLVAAALAEDIGSGEVTSAATVLAGERTALNFLQQLSDVATLTARCVRAVEGTGVRILDTRKTVPGMRLLQKQAFVAGGGTNYRVGLYDAILIKENHAALAGGVGPAVLRAKAHAPGLPIDASADA